MLMNDREIRLHMMHRITPWDDTLVQPASLDVRLGPGVKVPVRPTELIVGTDAPEYVEGTLPYTLMPGGFALFHTVETFTFPSYVAGKFEGKSGLGRMGLMTHVTAGFIDPGFEGQLTLELHNVGPYSLILNENIKIGQVAFYQVNQVEVPYGYDSKGSHYQDSVGVVGTRV